MISAPRGGRGRPSVDPRLDPAVDPDAGPARGDVAAAGRTMEKPRDREPPEIEIGEIWGRRRIIFLICSALFALLVVWFTREVVLPFVLAIIIAYVLTPLVGWC